MAHISDKVGAQLHTICWGRPQETYQFPQESRRADNPHVAGCCGTLNFQNISDLLDKGHFITVGKTLENEDYQTSVRRKNKGGRLHA